MSVFAYKLLKYVVLFLITMIVFVDVLPTAEESAKEAVTVIFLVPVVILSIPLFFLRQTFEVQKHIATAAYKRELKRISQQEAAARMKGSRQSELRNILPLVNLTKNELRHRARNVTPNILQAVEAKLSDYTARNDVNAVSKLYEVIVQTRPEQLNAQLVKLPSSN